ncbi:MAG: hypothetical protein JSS91_14030 [Bacteroidetes bacterium]|nr:hypothetical protein [Bacteroidota bacterium]
MKTLYLKYLTAVIFFFTCSGIYSQTDTNQIYNPGDIKIYYIIAPGDPINLDSRVTAQKRSYRSLDNINRLKFLNDSIISVFGENRPPVKLNLNKIIAIGIKNGSYTWTGIGLGCLGGAIAGAGIGAANDPPGLFHGLATGFGGFIGFFAGGLIGGIIGGNIDSDVTVNMDKSVTDQKAELKKILNIEY